MTLERNKLFIFEKVLFFVVLILCIWGFWYFEDSLILRIGTIILGSAGLYLVIFKVPSKNTIPSKLELGMLLILYFQIEIMYFKLIIIFKPKKYTFVIHRLHHL